MESSFTLLRVRGIPIGLNWSWLVIFAFFAWSLGAQLFPRTYPNLEPTAYAVMAVVAVILAFTTLLLHELGHAFRALREGVEIEGITLWLFGGVARFKGLFPSAGAEFRIAIAGPVVTAMLGVVLTALNWGLNQTAAPVEVVGVVDYLARLQWLLLGFNLLPAFPLDGGRVLRAYLWHGDANFVTATRSAARAGRVFGAVLIGLGLLALFTGAGLGGLIFAGIGWFIRQAAAAEASYAEFRQTLGGRSVGDLMTRDPDVVSPDRSIEAFIDGVAEPHGHSTYPVVDGGGLVGLISLRLAGGVPKQDRSTRTVRDVMLPAEDVPTLEPGADVMEAVGVLQQDPGRVVVTDDYGRVAGLLSRSDVARALEVAQLRGVEETPATRRRTRVVVWLVVGVTIFAAVAFLFQPPVVVLAPGESFDVTRDITIEGTDVDEVSGGYLLTSVSVSQPNGLGILLALAQSRTILPISAVIPTGVDPEEYFDEQEELFKQSQMVAAAAAARAAGMEVDLSGTGARVASVVSGAPAAEELEEGDVIIAVDGQEVTLADSIGRVVRSRPAGTTFELTIEREDRTFDVPVRSREGVVEGAPGIGVILETRDLDVDLPFEITFAEHEIGGPSAGLTYALATYDLIDPEDTARGRDVATSGTIDLEGRVGQVGGVKEKAAAAKNAGADIFLVPTEEVRGARGTGIDVRGVRTITEALEVLAATAQRA